jgi:hypothetical protein
MAGPKYRIVAVPKDPERRGGPGIECGSIWPGKFPGSLNLSPVKESSEGKYPKMTLAEALSGDYFLNVWPVSSPPPSHDDF